jgi:PIN domain nuclease of toxin-antitoxin system
MIVVLDASALCALIFDEKGAAKVEALLPDAVIGSVNLSEVIAKMQDKGIEDAIIDATLADLGLTVVSFDSEQATLAGKLRGATKAFNISLGDRACLALAIHRKCPAVTGDRAWKEFAKQVGVKLELFR